MAFPALDRCVWLVREAAAERYDPVDDADALEELGDEIATLAAHIHAATARLLELVAEFDRRRGWEPGGHRTCAHWLAVRTGIDLGAAREKVRTARALVELPATRAAMARGELSFSAVRALTRVATPDNEEALVELARGSTTAQLERIVRAWRRAPDDEAERERAAWESRGFSVFPGDDGTYVVRGRLPAEVGAVLMRAVEAAGDALYRESPVGAEARDDTGRAAARRRADAVGLLAERALEAGFGGRGRSGGEGEDGGDAEGGGGGGGGGGGEDGEDREGGATGAPISGTRAARYQVVLHVDAAMDGGELEDGTRVSAETSRRLACDAAVVRLTRGPDGSGGVSILDVGRRSRTVPGALRVALDARDRGCRFPGCGLRFADAHHVEHWADGGATALHNCLLLCGFHHRLVHEGGWRVLWDDEGRPVFVDPRGGEHYDGRPRPPRSSPGALPALNRVLGVEPDGWTAGARWEREAAIPDRVLFRAWEGLGSG